MPVQTLTLLPPVTDWDSNDIEAGTLDLPEIVERDKRIPMRLECVGARLLANLLAQGPLIYDPVIGRAVLFEDRRRDEPTHISVESTRM